MFCFLVWSFFIFDCGLGAFGYTSMSDSDAEELSVGVPSPVSAKERHHSSSMVIMDGDDEGSSSVSTSSYRMRNEGADAINDSNGAIQRHPTCALCKNHQTVSTLKGHKRYCPWRQCMCELCYSTNKKRKINAEQVALRRAQAQDEELRKKGIIQQLERISNPLTAPATPLSVPPSIQSSPQEGGGGSSGKSRPRSEQAQIPRDDRPPKVKIDVPPNSRPAALGCQSSPVVFGQQLSLGSILMGQNVSLLRESVCDTRLGFEMLRFLFRIIQDVKAEVEKVSCQLNDIHHEIQIKIHSGNVNFGPNPNLAYAVQDQNQKGNPVPPPVSIHHYQIPTNFQTQFRATVINGPYAPIHQPLYPNWTCWSPPFPCPICLFVCWFACLFFFLDVRRYFCWSRFVMFDSFFEGFSFSQFHLYSEFGFCFLFFILITKCLY